MGDSDSAETDELLHAYVDDLLPPKERLEVEGYLATNAELRARVADYRRQILDLHATYDAHLTDEPPRRIRELEQRLGDELARRRGSPRLGRATVTATLLAVVLGVGLYGADRLGAPVAGDDLIALLTEGADMLDTAAGDDVASLRAANTGTEPPAAVAARAAPDLGAFGFRLMASRAIRAGPDVEAVQLTYESPTYGRLLLYLSPRLDDARNEDKTSLSEEGAVSVLLWSDARRSYSMIGENLGRNAMLALGKAVNHAFADAPPPGQSDPAAGEPSPPRDRAPTHGSLPDKST